VLSFLHDDSDHEIEQENGSLTKFKDIRAHAGPLNQNDTKYKGSKYKVQVEWTDGHITYIPLNVLATDYSVSCAICVKRHELLHLPGWKQFK
jgi:hypothetical protein